MEIDTRGSEKSLSFCCLKIDNKFCVSRLTREGTGNFFAAMPKHLREKSELYGVELDTITGAIAKHLHPNSHIEIKGFETVAFNDNSFDLVISNVPFANIRIADNRYDRPYMIHDYFVKK